ncbi:MAG: DUF898 family protein [Afipia sp.]
MNYLNIPVVRPPEPPAQILFVGDRSEFSELVIRGAKLELFTLGFYRFWLATDIRRHLWSQTIIGDDAAEYTGRGKELLIGFLIALAILVPIYLAYFIAGLEAERIKAFASIPLVALLYVFGQFVVYRARRYRLTRTVWRGVRFWMDGSGWAYTLRASLWAILVVLTLGLALPWREAALERYKMRHSYYGSLQGRFEGRGWDFFKRGWWLWLFAIASILAMLLAPYFGRSFFFKQGGSGWLFATILLLTLSVPFVYGAFKAVQWRWWLSGIRFGDARLESNLSRGALISLYWKLIGWFLLLLIIFAAYMAASFFLIGSLSGNYFKTILSSREVAAQTSFLVATGIGYLLLALSANVVIRVYLLRDLWARVAGSISIHGFEATSSVEVRGELATALGEGFSDGLDVAGF